MTFEINRESRLSEQLLYKFKFQMKNDVSYALQYRFVRLDSLGRETVYPFSLSCSTDSPWNPREIVCEENYMEVSVRKNVPVIAQEGLEKEDWEAALSIVSELSTGIWVGGMQGFPDPSVFDGTYLSWVTPRLITPLVLHPTKFLDKRITMGVEGRALDEVAATSRGYQLLVNRTAVEIRIPFGAVGGYRKSHVIDNKYNQVYEIDLFLEHQWADDLWEVTQHRSFKPARSPYLPETPYVVNNTVPSEKGFTVTLGNFKPDVELKNLTLNGVPLTLPEAQNRGVKIRGPAPQRHQGLRPEGPLQQPAGLCRVHWGSHQEDISLRGLTVRVELNMRNVKTLQVEKQFVQRCPIPTRELLGENDSFTVVDTSQCPAHTSHQN
ncbi:UNVERIFIED_CONTAM: hypothetical protein FKN15_073806 [Acipenser sinensis]